MQSCPPRSLVESTLRRHFRDLPKSVSDLKDDPFRSLAGELRRAGGFAKDTTPFSESLWADFLRRKISRKNVVDNFERAISALPGARQDNASKKNCRGPAAQRRGYFGSRPIR